MKAFSIIFAVIAIATATAQTTSTPTTSPPAHAYTSEEGDIHEYEVGGAKTNSSSKAEEEGHDSHDETVKPRNATANNAPGGSNSTSPSYGNATESGSSTHGSSNATASGAAKSDATTPTPAPTNAAGSLGSLVGLSAVAVTAIVASLV